MNIKPNSCDQHYGWSRKIPEIRQVFDGFYSDSRIKVSIKKTRMIFYDQYLQRVFLEQYIYEP